MSQDHSALRGQRYTDQQVYAAYSLPIRPTNARAMALAFSCWPLAIVFGHLARRQIAKTGEGGKGWASAGLVIGYIFLVIVVLTTVAVVALISITAPSDSYVQTRAEEEWVRPA